MVEATQLMSTYMPKTMVFLKKVANLILQEILIHQNAQISISAETVQEYKDKILIIKVIVGLNQDIKCGKLKNMEKLVEHKR